MGDPSMHQCSMQDVRVPPGVAAAAVTLALLRFQGQAGPVHQPLGAWVRNTRVGVLRRCGDAWDTWVCLRMTVVTACLR